MAQLSERVYSTDYRIDPARKGELRIEIDNLSFFKDNEYGGLMLTGYSLPGLWLQPRVCCYPLANLKVEAGFHLLKYWGATKYPNMTYIDIAKWQQQHYQHSVHLLPFFRVQVAFSEHVDIILGNLYGGANHKLIEPLYTSELNLTSDPEAGLQILYHSRHFDADAWVNWQSFIFREDIHQEAFTGGLSARLKWGEEKSAWKFYIPLQGLAQHRGGEIDTIFTNSVQTLMNGAVGAGVTWHPDSRNLREIGLETEVLGYCQQSGQLWPYGSGTAWYAHVWADINYFRLKAAYFSGNSFISMYGLPFFGSVSVKRPDLDFRHPRIGYAGLEYSYTFGQGFAIGADADLYLQFTEAKSYRKKICRDFSFGVYLRISPSFLLTTLKPKS